MNNKRKNREVIPKLRLGVKPAATEFGLTAKSQPSTGLFGASTSFGAASTPAFGAAGSTTGFGSTSTAPAFGAGNLSFGATATSTAPAFGATSSAPAFGATSTAPSLGLGGAAPLGAAAAPSDSKTEPRKQTKMPNEIVTSVDSFMPNEIVTSVDSFKEFVKKQKSISSEIMRVSVKPLYNVSREAESTIRAVLSLTSEVLRARAQSKRLRTATAHALAIAETVHNAPEKLDGSAPPSYVNELIGELEQTLQAFKRQMDVADKQMQTAPKLLTEQELTVSLRRMHTSQVALGERLKVVHSQVDRQKEQYLNLRKYILKDPTNVFDTPTCNTSLEQILRDAEGTRKESKTNRWFVSLGSAVIADPRVALGSNIQQLAGPSPFSYVGTTLSPFPTTDTNGPSCQAPHPSTTTLAPTTFNTSFAPQQTESTGFTLQKPPGKRGHDQMLRDAEGTRKKSKTNRWSSSVGSAVIADPRIALGSNIQQLAGPSPFSYVGTTLSPFPTTDTNGPSWQAPHPSTTNLAPTTFNTSFAPQQTESTGFTLQKPPGKRGKQ